MADQQGESSYRVSLSSKKSSSDYDSVLYGEEDRNKYSTFITEESDENDTFNGKGGLSASGVDKLQHEFAGDVDMRSYSDNFGSGVKNVRISDRENEVTVSFSF